MADKQSIEIGKRIKRLRIEAQLTQASLGEKADIPPNTIARLERGVHRISDETLRKLTKALNATASDILGY